MLVAPTRDRHILFTVEGEDLYSYQLIHLDGPVKLIELPIEEKHVPNIFLSAAMVNDRQVFIDTKQVVVPPVKNFLTVNVSSPNTPGLRNLQQAAALDELLARVIDARERVAVGAARKPVLLKIAPDLTLGDLDDAVGVARRHRVDGMIVGNTTISRPNLREAEKAKQEGGLSGRPLFALSTRMLAETYVRAEGAFPLIGVGGIDSGAAAFAKIKAGAHLVQLYSGLIFRGIGLVGSIKSDLLDFLRIGRMDSLADAVGRDAAEVTAQPWPR